MDWKIYYYDGTTYSSVDGLWADAPLEGVILVQRLPPEPSGFDREILWYHDYFLFRPGTDDAPFSTNDLVSVLQGMGITPPDPFPKDPRAYLPTLAPPADTMVKYGMLVPKEDWFTINNVAVADTDFPSTVPRRRRSNTDWPDLA